MTLITKFSGLNGSIYSESRTYSVFGDVELESNGQLTLQGQIKPAWSSLSDRRGVYEAKLKSSDGWELTAEQVFNTKTENDKFEAQPGRIIAIKGSNPIGSDTISTAVFTGGDKSFAGIANIHIGRKQITVRGYRLPNLLSSIAICTIKPSYKNLSSDWKILGVIQSLLSLAYSRYIKIPLYERRDSMNNIYMVCHPAVVKGMIASPILRIDNPTQVPQLIESGYKAWRTIAGLNLVHLINLYILSKNQEFPDAALMLGSIWLEAFKHQYAKNIAAYSQNSKGFFLRPSSSSKKGFFGFKELVNEGMKHFGCRKPYKAFKDDRNDVIHTGIAAGGLQAKNRRRQQLEQIIELFLLNVMGFKGDVWDYRLDKWVTCK